MTESDNNRAKMPVLFIGHGNPMNAIEENEFVLALKDPIEKVSFYNDKIIGGSIAMTSVKITRE